jgi:hypothetical protein
VVVRAGGEAVTVRIPIRSLTALRPAVTDQALLDYLDLSIITPEPGIVTTRELRERWQCSQPQVSRRINAMAVAGLVDVSSHWGGYRVHHLAQLGASR